MHRHCDVRLLCRLSCSALQITNLHIIIDDVNSTSLMMFVMLQVGRRMNVVSSKSPTTPSINHLQTVTCSLE